MYASEHAIYLPVLTCFYVLIFTNLLDEFTQVKVALDNVFYRLENFFFLMIDYWEIRHPKLNNNIFLL